ncbi:MAG TPA: hydantoinase/oxoprolinase family protein [Rubrobacteraceae bacterium]|nr:hydantoinase/oxoprolinase family protein [Rubrobacteraceae bacterium]
MDRRYRVGVDIGGTFTDLVLIDDATGERSIGKVLTTPQDPSDAVEKGLAELLEREGVEASQIKTIVHGTTLVTNALIERKGATTALLTTQGFRDAISIGTEHRYDMYDIYIEKPEPLVPRNLRYGVRERVLDDGSVAIELDEEQLRQVVAELREREVEAVAVSFLHSFRNSTHEQRVARVLAEEAPGITVSLSSDVAPEIREYERTSTTIANVYVRPLVERYLRVLEERLTNLGFGGSLYIMLSNGGTASVETAREFPIRLLESGPAAGALAAAFYGLKTGFSAVLSFDMGGTTAKACLIEGGEPLTASEFEVARVYRFKKGSGLPVKTSVIEMIEIGAGGGSIARVGPLGLPKVGPESAGADPGPACYGRGGSEPTVTDADLILGYLDPDFFLGGRMHLDRDAALKAIEEGIARPLGLDPIEAAWGIHQVVNENMANAARIHAIERGKDPRAYPLFAFGGAGPVHAYSVARALGVPGFVAPLGAGATSAFGFLCAPLSFDFVRSLYGRLDELDWSVVNGALEEMEKEGRDLLRASGVADADIRVRRLCDMRYTGQGHEVTVELPVGALGPDDTGRLASLYSKEYRRLYNREGPDVPLEALTWRLEVAAPPPEIRLEAGEEREAASGGRKGAREIYLPEEKGFREVPVYDRYRLGPGAAFEGPAVIEEKESTVILGPEGRAKIDAARNLIVKWS